MLNPNKLIASLLSLVLVFCIACFLISAAWHVNETVPLLHAKFKIGDCFRSAPPLHRWEPADGMVFNMDATDYLVVYAPELASKRPIEPAYVGTEKVIESFDRQHEVVLCPYKWGGVRG